MNKVKDKNNLFTPRLNAVLEVDASDWVDLDGNVITFPPGWAIDEASINPARRMTCAVNLSTKTFSAVAFGFQASAMYVDAPPSSQTTLPVTDAPEEGATDAPAEGATDDPEEGATDAPAEGVTDAPEEGATPACSDPNASLLGTECVM